MLMYFTVFHCILLIYLCLYLLMCLFPYLFMLVKVPKRWSEINVWGFPVNFPLNQSIEFV